MGRPPPALRLLVGARTVSFNTLDDLDFCLSSKTQVPAGRVPSLMALPQGALRRQAADLRDTEQRLADLLACAGRDGVGADELLLGLEPQVFSQDHGWRDVMLALRAAGPAAEPSCALALARYLEYMQTRRRLLDQLCEHKAARAAVAADEADSALRETAVFDLNRMDLAERQLGALRRLPRGVPTTLRLPGSEVLELMLSRHRFTLRGGRRWRLSDEAGREYPLRRPRNLVGRLRSCDTVIDGACAAVSRSHLIIEPLGPDRVCLTDLSSHGTFVSPEAVVGAGSGLA